MEVFERAAGIVIGGGSIDAHSSKGGIPRTVTSSNLLRGQRGVNIFFVRQETHSA